MQNNSQDRSNGRIRRAIAEMLGRPLEKLGPFDKIRAKFNPYKNVITLDTSRTSVGLARACFYANLYQDRKTKTIYGEDYLLGATLAKPIVNIAASFALAEAPRIIEEIAVTDKDDEATDPVGDEDGEKEEILHEDDIENTTVTNVNKWLDDHTYFLWLCARNEFRDGDVFVVMDDEGQVFDIPSEDVDIIKDPLNPNKIAGYDIFTAIEDPKDDKKVILYVDEIRTTYRRRCTIDENDKRNLVPGTLEEYRNIEDGGIEERQLPVVHFANEKEGRMLYGVSDYQSLYYLFANYHAVLANAIKGNIYNSTSVPVVQGVKKIKEFLEHNMESEKDPDTGGMVYKLKWNPEKMLVVGEGGSVSMLQGNDTAAGAQILLNILFWLISQNSETPEFAFGTAVQSSKASVSEQTPMLIKKAIRKQAQLKDPIRQLVSLYIERMARLRPDEFDPEMEFSVSMPQILDDDLNVNSNIVSVLLDDGLITEETALIMLNIGKYVKDLRAELKKAKAQKKLRGDIAKDAFGLPVNGQDQEEEELKNTKDAELQGKTAQEMAEDGTLINAFLKKYGIKKFATKFDGVLTEDELKKYVGVTHVQG